MLVYQKTTGFSGRGAGVEIFCLKTILLGFFSKFCRAEKLFSALTGRVIERGLSWNSARACKLFSVSAICGEAMRDCAELLSEAIKNPFGDSVREKMAISFWPWADPISDP